ncbi:MAG: hypothetical protein HQ523_02370 [Lentisphaerae bacterium]|nr:hypothetical protein [Lentisphaerota bacterium]
MQRRWVINVLVILWVALVALAFIQYSATEATDSGFTRGFNRIGLFLKWQAAALLTAFFAWQSARRARPTLGRAKTWPGYVPIVLSGGFFLAIILFYGIAVLLARF